MIYIYRTLWLLFYVPVFIIELLSFILSMVWFIFAGIFYYIKTGDIENTPDMFVPGNLTFIIDYWYKGLEEKIERL